MPRPGRRNRLAAVPLHILDLATTHWVDFWWLVARHRQIKIHLQGDAATPNAHAVKNAPQFRQYLLRVHQGKGGMHLSDFATPRVVQDPERVGAFDTFPAEVAAWCEKGRRLYRIDHSLQTLLRLTSLNNVQWDQVYWPFDAFAIELSQPITDPAGKVWDFILVSTYNNEDLLLKGEAGPVLQMSFFSRARSQYEPIRVEDRQKLESFIARGQWRDAVHLGARFEERFQRPVVIPRSVFRYPKAKLTGSVTDTASRWRDELQSTVTRQIPEGAYEIWDAMIRIVVGLALYLKTLPTVNQEIKKINQPRREGLPDATIITDNTEIFTVSSVIPLTPDELKFEEFGQQQEAGGTAKYEMRTHWRQGYWSRKPGEGQNPDAEKSVWHRPTLVRKDRLPQDMGLPGGAASEDQHH